MRVLLALLALCLAPASALPQDQPKTAPRASNVCSVPLLRMSTPRNLDPLIVSKVAPVADRMPVTQGPAPPCDEPNKSLSAARQVPGSLRWRLSEGALKRLLRQSPVDRAPATGDKENPSQPEPQPPPIK